ncbi:MAG TPA: folylpolyglutamate synthase/dihydrofolate synthase family protein [Flavobacteriaceae bacterium]|nr:folylpolyglutamate synthase/dihydrofolate synthase family protein [Flavobacteriaceae bacterium]
MNYQETVTWMFTQLPMYQRQGASAFRKDLTNTLKLAAHLKHPETAFKSIHVAGTNGKGSTSHMLASILQEAGYKVGLYTSPHLKDFRERIKINGKDVSKQFVMGFIRRNRAFFEAEKLSFFEMTVGMAFDYFRKQQVDIAVIEVGMGGRLDSTNIITPEVSVITNISLDHTQFLGNTLAAIAGEKAGVIKLNKPVVIGEYHSETAPVFKEVANEKQAPLTFASKQDIQLLESDLKGSYQQHNIKTVLATVEILQQRGYKIKQSHIDKGLKSVVKNTGLKGRWQKVQENPTIICDTGHNESGLKFVFEQINKETFKTLHIVFGVVNDKDLKSLVQLLPKNAIYYFCKPDVPRGLDAEILRVFLKDFRFKGNAYNSVNEALESAKKAASKTDFIFVGGSTFVVAEII